MPARKTSKKKVPASAPPIGVSLHAPSAEGGLLSASQLSKLFQRAWLLVPAGRRPDLQAQRRVAVDVHAINDAEITELNERHMRIAEPTDVLSFTMAEIDPERRAFNLGEIMVSYDTARREAAARKLPPEEELSRYCVHGFLHLLGYEDDTDARRRAMFKLQEAALKRPRSRKTSR